MVLIAITGFGGLGTQNMLNDHVAGFYPADARATGLGWALGVGRLGAIAGPTYGAFFVAAGAPVLVSRPLLRGTRADRRGDHELPAPTGPLDRGRGGRRGRLHRRPLIP